VQYYDTLIVDHNSCTRPSADVLIAPGASVQHPRR